MATAPEAPYTLSPEQIQSYRQNGYVKLRGALAPEVIEEYRADISRVAARLNTQTRPLEERTVYEKAFLQIHNLWRRDEAIKRFVLSQRLGRIAAELMGTRGVRIYHDQALFKEPGGGITPWHADQYYWPVDSDRTVTAWIPLQPTPLEMGPLAFARGSFRLTLGRDVEIGAESENLLRVGLRDFPMDEGPFELGEVSFHSGWTFHRAGVNSSDRVREVMTIIYVDRDIRLTEPKNKNQANDREWWAPGVEVGQVLASPINPVVFEFPT